MRRTLRAGVIVSAVLLTAGLGLWILDAGRLVTNGLLHAGFIALLATPVLGMISLIRGFVRERDWLAALVTLAVLTILAGGLLMAVGHDR